MGISVGELAAAIGGNAEGDSELRVHGLAEPEIAGPFDLALAYDSKFRSLLADSMAQAALLRIGASWREYGIKSAILVRRPRHALALASTIFSPPSEFEPGIHPSAIISPTARIGAGCRIGPFTVVQPGTSIGAGSIVGSSVSIGCNVRIGERAVIYPGVRIGRNVVIGHRFIAHANSVFGSDGFAFETDNEKSGETTASRRQKINSLGSVLIGDDVEVGANCAIDRGTISNTVIGSGTKLDNLVHVAHNVRIG
ncbi:MAG: UDP-3-O-(3-hydroxymyristoyl)glucosamine N-acyltransferase, partial [Albidovulum sp.]|nr:UDP-3-O-(3-hydroxymyristoyl)glucosamine N-acyltransferase [Albidovulum sp.]